VGIERNGGEGIEEERRYPYIYRCRNPDPMKILWQGI
jgi:hypothetical protein